MIDAKTNFPCPVSRSARDRHVITVIIITLSFPPAIMSISPPTTRVFPGDGSMMIGPAGFVCEKTMVTWDFRLFYFRAHKPSRFTFTWRHVRVGGMCDALRARAHGNTVSTSNRTTAGNGKDVVKTHSGRVYWFCKQTPKLNVYNNKCTHLKRYYCVFIHG